MPCERRTILLTIGVNLQRLSVSSVAIKALPLTVVLALTNAVFAQQPAVTCHVEGVPMRDGTLLATEVYLPSGPGPFPVVMQRTPYNEILPAPGSNCNNPTLMSYAANGYVGLNQDVRGMYRSPDDFHAMVQEANDGYDAIEWAAVQPWSTGKVGMFSGSYVGLTQWQPAIHTPPHLAAIAPAVTASDYHDNWTYVDAVFDLWFAQSWILLTFGPETYKRQLVASGLPPAEVTQKVNDWIAQGDKNILTSWVWQLPLTSFDVFQGLAPYYYDWLAHPSYDPFWAQLDVETRYKNVMVPALISGGWYDIFQVGTLRNFHGMRSEGGTAEARTDTKLVMTCCGHAGTSGTVNWGPSTTDPTLTLRFFDHYLKGIDNGVEREAVVQMDLLVPPDTGTTGSSFLVTANEFPLPGTRTMTLALRSGGHANTRLGDGALVVHDSADADEHDGPGSRPDHFDYNPQNPAPTVGGNMCCNTTLLPAAAHDQSVVELRNDVLVYTSAPLDRDVAVIGPVTVKLWAKSSAPDTDFTAKLVDVHLDGFAHNVLDRIVRARYRSGSKLPPSLIEPGKPYEYSIELGNAGTVFRKGHRIRLEISSSNFPHYARNLNTGRSNEDTSQAAVAHQTIMHNPGHPSYLVLPIVPDIAIPRP